MNVVLDKALCIGGNCPQRHSCARWTVYNRLQESTKIKAEYISITTPPYTYEDGCFMYLSTKLEAKGEQP